MVLEHKSLALTVKNIYVNTKVIGIKIVSMVKENPLSLMDHITGVNTSMISEMVMVYFLGLMVMNTRACGKMTEWKAKVFSDIMRVVNLKVTSKITIFIAMASLFRHLMERRKFNNFSMIGKKSKI